MCATMEDVRRAHAALHGRTVQVGLDRVGIYVSNDILSAASVMGTIGAVSLDKAVGGTLSWTMGALVPGTMVYQRVKPISLAVGRATSQSTWRCTSTGQRVNR